MIFSTENKDRSEGLTPSGFCAHILVFKSAPQNKKHETSRLILSSNPQRRLIKSLKCEQAYITQKIHGFVLSSF